jgi:hypothetical protein
VLVDRAYLSVCVHLQTIADKSSHHRLPPPFICLMVVDVKCITFVYDAIISSQTLRNQYHMYSKTCHVIFKPYSEKFMSLGSIV